MTVSITSNHNRDLGSGQTGNLAHNRRVFIPGNVDRNLVCCNVVFVDRKLGEVYLECFGDAIIAKNSKQKRKDRIKTTPQNYFKKMFGTEPDSCSAQKILTSNARGGNEVKSYNEEIFQVGDCNEFGHFMRDDDGNFIDKNGNPVKWNKFKNKYYDVNGKEVTDGSNLKPNPKAEIAKEILGIFYCGGHIKIGNEEVEILPFEERNPNFKVVCAVEHNDEWHGTPHLHIDYVPVGTGYVKGPEKQLGFERALANMGFRNRKTAYIEWREKERQILKNICNSYGFETKTKEEECANNRGVTYTTDVYRDAVREGRADARMIKEIAEDDAAKIRETAEIEAENVKEAAKKEACEIKQSASDDANRITENAYCEERRARAENERLAEEKFELMQESRHQREQIDLLCDAAINLPTKKFNPFGKSEKYIMDSHEYAKFCECVGNIKRWKDNTLTSDEALRTAENERKIWEQKNENQNQIIREQAEIIAMQMIQKRIDELEEEKKKYRHLCKNAKTALKKAAIKYAEDMSSSFAKQDAESKRARYETACAKFRFDEFKDDEMQL